MSGAPDERIVGLAGLFQAVGLVDVLALTGKADTEPFATSIGSIYTLDADSAVDCYPGGVAALETGREVLASALDRNAKFNRVLRYAFTLMALERKLAADGKRRRALAEGIAGIRLQTEHLGPTHDQVVARIADVYVETISSLRPRVLVQGSPLYLQQERIVTRVRALLLAGLRSAVLWRQLGGSRWHFIFARSAIRRTLAAWPARAD